MQWIEFLTNRKKNSAFKKQLIGKNDAIVSPNAQQNDEILLRRANEVETREREVT